MLYSSSEEAWTVRGHLIEMRRVMFLRKRVDRILSLNPSTRV
jgi:hypothetical protein